jgi:argininosuccinate lyase
MTRLWDRGEPLDALVLRYTAGEDHVLDERLVDYDLQASAAHATMLHGCGHLKQGDLEAILSGLDRLRASHAAGQWHVAPEEEDCHTAIERRLTALVGEPGRAIHLGRSRNDQVLAALRLFLKDALADLSARANTVANALDTLAAEQGDTPMPGYTHMQRAMRSTVGLWAGGHAAEVRDDADGLLLARRRADLNPLGSAAGYGVPVLSLDREATTQALGFQATHEPVTAVQLSRGKAEATALFEASLLAQDLGRLAADLCLFATSEFGFVSIPSTLTTGSSMLPQKRNPDLFELARGRSSEAQAALVEVMGITSRLPSGYHRDLQLIKKPLFRGLDSARDTCEIMAHALPLVRFLPDRLQAALDPSLRMVERAYEIVRDEGLAFRDAYVKAREG